MVIFQQNTCKTGFFERFHLLFERKKNAQLNVIMSLYTYILHNIYSQFQYTPLLEYCRYICNEEKDQKQTGCKIMHFDISVNIISSALRLISFLNKCC